MSNLQQLFLPKIQKPSNEQSSNFLSSTTFLPKIQKFSGEQFSTSFFPKHSKIQRWTVFNNFLSYCGDQLSTTTTTSQIGFNFLSLELLDAHFSKINKNCQTGTRCLLPYDGSHMTWHSTKYWNSLNYSYLLKCSTVNKW